MTESDSALTDSPFNLFRYMGLNIKLNMAHLNELNKKLIGWLIISLLFHFPVYLVVYRRKYFCSPDIDACAWQKHSK